LYRVRSLEGETPPNSSVLFPVVFENEASTPLFGHFDFARQLVVPPARQVHNVPPFRLAGSATLRYVFQRAHLLLLAGGRHEIGDLIEVPN
jgi:hypothetical protein